MLCLPSWSWMRYEGAIDYLDVPLGEVDWDLPDDRMFSPWKSHSWGLWHMSDGDAGNVNGKTVLKANARTFIAAEHKAEDCELFFDKEEWEDPRTINLRCVVAGRMKMIHSVSVDDTIHYVLLITPLAHELGDKQRYVRFGVGFMAGRYIDWTATKVVDIE
jgi:hypothetical protein